MWKQWKPMVFSTFSLTLHYLGRLSWCPPGTFSISASSSRGTSSGEFSSCTASPHISSHSHPFSWYSHIFSWDMMIFSFWMMMIFLLHISWYPIRKMAHHSEDAQVPKNHQKITRSKKRQRDASHKKLTSPRAAEFPNQFGVVLSHHGGAELRVWLTNVRSSIL